MSVGILIYRNCFISAVPLLLTYITLCAMTAFSQEGDKVRFGVMLLLYRCVGHSSQTGSPGTLPPASWFRWAQRAGEVAMAWRAFTLKSRATPSGSCHLELAIQEEGSVISLLPHPVFSPSTPIWQHWHGIRKGRILPVTVKCHCQGNEWLVIVLPALLVWN